MKYAEYPVAASLADRVECVWFAEDPGAAAGHDEPERVLPDGCAEWIFHLGQPYSDGAGRLQPRSFVVGPTTRPIEIAPTGPVATLGVRFRPGGARGVLPPLRLLSAGLPTPEEMWDAEGRGVQEEVGNGRDMASRLGALKRFLENRLRRARSPGGASRLPAAVDLVLGSRGRLAVAAIADRVACSRRQLEREFAEGVGLSPKELSRVARFQNVLRLAARRPGASWADLAARCGYSDQAHLVREFKALSGATPTSREELTGALARYFIDPARLDSLLSPVAFLQDTNGSSA
jgi:AraC-like DNA-binding protein